MVVSMKDSPRCLLNPDCVQGWRLGCSHMAPQPWRGTSEEVIEPGWGRASSNANILPSLFHSSFPPPSPTWGIKNPLVRDLGVEGRAWLSLTGWPPCKASSPGLGVFVCKRRWFTAGGWGESSLRIEVGF